MPKCLEHCQSLLLKKSKTHTIHTTHNISKRTAGEAIGTLNSSGLEGKTNQKHHCDAFYDHLVTAGYPSRITLPTLLDNIFTNILEEYTSGVIINSRTPNDLHLQKYNIPNLAPIGI